MGQVRDRVRAAEQRWSKGLAQTLTLALALSLTLALALALALALRLPPSAQAWQSTGTLEACRRAHP